MTTVIGGAAAEGAAFQPRVNASSTRALAGRVLYVSSMSGVLIDDDMSRSLIPDSRQLPAASPILSTPRCSTTVVSQSGSISGTDDSSRSV